ncbi:Dbl domain-containing protein [Lentinula aff. lateritia]|uniref:Dbl domain-containing protein n=1 Tax=Lentinula aff. lateritia TaxID=2804960 RepID=A0ACC1U479_9AGAR|nr:Dbl domain-containing protein [Lentinula aff. lateritia]
MTSRTASTAHSGGTATSASASSASTSRILSATSWSQVTEDDLVSNLGARERTRQEVLFEIIQSEERYVGELGKMREMFIEPLLHPYSGRGVGSPEPQGSFGEEQREEALPPIAARFMSPTPTTTTTGTGDSSEEEEDNDDENNNNAWRTHPRSPYRVVAPPVIPFPSGARSHQSLPPASKLVSTQSLGRQSFAGRERSLSQTQTKGARGMFKQLRKVEEPSLSPSPLPLVPPHLLPPDLRICLEVIDSGVFEGHRRLAEALRKRYDDQYPLVRSLADVFVANSDIFSGYATYVLHLERALDQVDNALKSPPSKSKSKPKPRTPSPSPHTVPPLLRTLDQLASTLGHTSLAISLSKPFQRLLKYPLLFQNLLYHTDPSTVEYESTLQMVAEIEVMVRGIEDEKVAWEDREKTRDVLGRIEWGEGAGAGPSAAGKEWVGRPKPGRVLLHECPAPTPPAATTAIQSKKSKPSFRRLSDALSPPSAVVKPCSKRDVWTVHFNDVVLLCQRTGFTTVPVWSSGGERKGKDPPRQLRGTPRNLYRFIRVHTWAIGDVVQPTEGVVAMADIERTRQQQLPLPHPHPHSHLPSSHPRIIPMPPDDENPRALAADDSGEDSSDSDRRSKMSFSYWGADKVTVHRPASASTPTPASSSSSSSTRRDAYSRESSANAKFGSRLVSERDRERERPASRRTAPRSRTATGSSSSTPGGGGGGGDSAKSTVVRSPVSVSASPTPSGNPTPTPTTTNTLPLPLPSRITPSTSQTRPPVSPAASEDSGVGLYRQMMAKEREREREGGLIRDS